MSIQRTNYPKPHPQVVTVYDTEADGGKRVSWDNEKIKTLLEAIKTVNGGEFIKLLKSPPEEKKMKMQVLKTGWDLVRRVMLTKFPDFSLTRVQLSDKWRKLHKNKIETSTEVTKKSTDELMKEFKVGEFNDYQQIASLKPDHLEGSDPHLQPIMHTVEYTVETQVDPKMEAVPVVTKRKTTEEVVAELENDTSYIPPPKKKLKKGFMELQGRTPVETKRIELMVREHKVRMEHENEMFQYEKQIKLKKLEILELVKNKIEGQQTVNLDDLSI